MTATLDDWHARNDEYLAVALAQLRQRLDAAARPTPVIAMPSSVAAADTAGAVMATAPAVPAATAVAAASMQTPAASPARGALRFFRRQPPLALPFAAGAAAAVAGFATPPTESAAAPTPAAAAAANAPPPQAAPAEPMTDDFTSRLAALSDTEPPPALPLLARRLGLTAFERDILLLCIAPELDTGIAAQCAAAQGQPDRDHPTFALALALFPQPAWSAMSPERPLRYWRLIEINQPGARALTASALRADERIVNFCKGLNALDDRLAPLVSPLPRPVLEALPGSQRALIARLAQVLDAARAAGALDAAQALAAAGPSQAVVELRGSDRTSKRQVAGAAAAGLGLVPYRLPAETLPVHAGELDTLARLWHRESLLLPLLLVVDAHGLDQAGGAEGPLPRLARFVARTGGLVFVDSRDGVALPLEPLLALDVARPSTAEQQAAWSDALQLLGQGAADSAARASRLAAQFDLNLPDIRNIAATAPTAPAAPVPTAATAAAAAAAAPDHASGMHASDASDTRATAAAMLAVDAAEDDDTPASIDPLWAACRDKTRPQLARLAERIDAKATWPQLVLPAPEAAALRQIAAQVRARGRVYDDWGFRARMNRGLGVSALFAGDSGTGKTMAAEVLANALALDLYRIDLSAVVSKYIGETEKNLREVFDAAEAGGAILLFDEADALFGKRSEVKDAHDRYANIETDYLLQRMEAFGGLAILATNLKSSLDSAFVRRLRFIVQFPYPGQAERKRIWQRVFPADTPLGPLDHERLARLHVTGGNIQSMALHAAFMAAQAGTPVTMNLLLEAGRHEFRKLERPVNEAEFRWIASAGKAAP